MRVNGPFCGLLLLLVVNDHAGCLSVNWGGSGSLTWGRPFFCQSISGSCNPRCGLLVCDAGCCGYGAGCGWYDAGCSFVALYRANGAVLGH